MRQMQGGTATRQWSIMLVLLPLCLIPGVLVGQEAERNPARTPAPPAPFVLTIQERLLSLSGHRMPHYRRSSKRLGVRCTSTWRCIPRWKST